jgi:hypothetical protein
MVWNTEYKALLEKYPEYFDIRRSCRMSVVGPEILPGWSSVVERLLINLRDECADMGGYSVTITSIKKKYAMLRVSVDTALGPIPPGRIARWLEIAERESARVCEACGARRAVHSRAGWVTTLCEDCLDTRIAMRTTDV